MATVLRVKRRCEDEPLDHLLISCKRKKINEETEESHVEADVQNLHRAVVKFAGTFDHQEINIAKHLKNQTKDDIETNYKKPTIKNVIENSRIKVKESSRQNRWKVINCSRSVDNKIDDDDEKISDNGMTIIDVEDCSTELPHDEAAKYVYDIYYAENDSNDELSFDTGVTIHEMEEGWLVYDDHREGEGYNCDDPDDSDSNSESNWRTDYGDEEDDYIDNDNDSLVDEDDMVQAFNRCGVDDEFDNPYDEESSDDDDYYKDKLDQADINIGGLLYAKYKAKLRLKVNRLDEDDDDDDDKTKSDSETSNSSDSIVTENSTDDEQMIE
ncbi:hypothetical protein HCN44_002347 [Aphidius gifuensis]|uniref:Probable RNA polymerase II nuclear localization protein SLC7A6OS n=2 Tax=Aphidius gifuensis TaxID=684658 RepID=A0A834Y127_APHGI|nr:hypothetical protein HCN44_002347 [Aphidius gifuensis]